MLPRQVASAAWGFFGSVVLAGLVLRWEAGDHILIGRYSAYVMPWLLAGILPGMALAAVRRRWVLAVLLGSSAAIIIRAYAPLFTDREPPRPGASAPLKVLSYNTWSRNHDVDRIASVIGEQRPDIVLLQEIQPKVFEGVELALRRAVPGLHSVYQPRLEQGILSRYPVKSSVAMEAKGQALKVVLQFPGTSVTVIDVHPMRTGGWRRRYEEINSLLVEDILPEKNPVILGGDFNATDQSELYGLVAAHLKNAHWEAGSGFGFTFPTTSRRLLGLPLPPLVRIDHLFFSSHFVALRAGTLEDSGGSDHLPIFTDLAFR
jgi:endonuclease/exonuclease/phosphatase (EEP) superfamily protein YafD